jgi:tetratricopeptide (TPR) repeat protein
MSRGEDRLWERAQGYIAQGQATAARIALEALVQRNPAHAGAHVHLGALAYAEDRLRDSTRHTLDAARHLPDDAEAVGRIALTLLQVGETLAARRCLEHPCVTRCRNGATLARLAGARQMLGDHDLALELLDRALATGHDNADFRYIRSVQLMFNGRIDDAEAELDTCLRMGSTYGRASVTLARLHRQTHERNHVDYIRAQLQRVAPGSEDHGAFEYALYKELEDLGDYAGAWAALERGAAIMFARAPYDTAGERRLIDWLMRTCDADFLARRAPAQAGAQPIFIIGMPRSGTTVLDRILGNHSQVVSAGELGDFARALRWGADHKTVQPVDEVILARVPQLDFAEIGGRYLAQTQWRAGDKRFYVDKLPINWIQAGFIRRALPGARILHMTRDAMDTCFSNLRAFFGVGYAYSYSIDALAAHYGHYRRTLDHWHAAMPGQILDVPYEDLVDDPETVARRVMEFCGLAYEPGCVELGRNTAPVATLSSGQVREAIHRRSIGEWQRYERQLQPLQAALASAG